MANKQQGLVDALPYIDSGYDDPGVRDAVLSMIEEETKRYKPTKNYLEFLGSVDYNSFETDIMKTEFGRIENQKQMEPLNMKRYELPPPPPNRLNDLNAWTESVNNSQAQLEHQANRILNLKLMNIYGAESWKSYNAVLEKLLQKAQKELAHLRKSIQEVNYARKKAQTDAGQKLGHLETNWVGLVSKNYEIEQACVQLEEEISMLETHTKQARRISSIEADQDPEEESHEPQSKKQRTEQTTANEKSEENRNFSQISSQSIESDQTSNLSECSVD